MNSSIIIEPVTENKKNYLELLLLADEQESMIDLYLDRGVLYVCRTPTGEVLAVCVCTDEGPNVYEIKNIAVSPAHRREGIGRICVDFIASVCRVKGGTLLRVGTGDVPSTRLFYESCGFVYTHRLANFFLLNYDHPIIEDGIQLVDMIYLARKL